jgi:hypothetical protein
MQKGIDQSFREGVECWVEKEYSASRSHHGEDPFFQYSKGQQADDLLNISFVGISSF